jgi:hypothetical protein
MRLPLLLLVAVSLCAPAFAVEPNHVWTDRESGEKTVARLANLGVKVVKDDGSTASILMDNLSDDDRRYLAKWLLSQVEDKEPLASTLSSAPEIKPSTKRETPAIAYAPRPSTSSNKKTPGTEVHVKGYYRKDGTYVQPHTRSKPKK